MPPASSPKTGDVDRRRFLRGGWVAGPASEHGEIASILVQTRPERLAAAEQAIAAIPGAEIFGRDPIGKLVVVVEAAEVGAVGGMLNTIAVLPDVLTANLVFHAASSS
jgi:periplasmic nitrate reductase NapD